MFQFRPCWFLHGHRPNPTGNPGGLSLTIFAHRWNPVNFQARLCTAQKGGMGAAQGQHRGSGGGQHGSCTEVLLHCPSKILVLYSQQSDSSFRPQNASPITPSLERYGYDKRSTCNPSAWFRFTKSSENEVLTSVFLNAKHKNKNRLQFLALFHSFTILSKQKGKALLIEILPPSLPFSVSGFALHSEH